MVQNKISPSMYHREGLKKIKKIWIYPYLGGWLGQERANIHKKNIPLKSILSHFRSNFFPFLEGGRSDQALIQVAPYACIYYGNPPVTTANL